MPLSRTTKARILLRLNPRTLVVGTLVLGLAVGVLTFFTVFARALGWDLPNIPYGSLFLLTLPVHGFRWWAIRRGWSAITRNELSKANLSEQLMNAADRPLSPELQLALLNKARTLPWLAWSDILEMAKETGLNDVRLHGALFLGGHVSPIARANRWKEVVDDNVWRAGDLHQALPSASAETRPKIRF